MRRRCGAQVAESALRVAQNQRISRQRAVSQTGVPLARAGGVSQRLLRLVDEDLDVGQRVKRARNQLALGGLAGQSEGPAIEIEGLGQVAPVGGNLAKIQL